jgi:hypothetical protein
MTPIVPGMLIGIIPLALVVFSLLPPRRAMLAVMIFGWLFLPQIGGWAVNGIPDYNKATAIVLAPLLGVMIFDFKRLMTFRPSWFDLPMLVWLICPVLSAVSNDVGPGLGGSIYGGLTMVLVQVVLWGIPYYLGRVYFRTLADLRELAMALFIAGLVYVPFCLFEVRFTPNLHKIMYGRHAGDEIGFQQTMRLDWYRPTVFLQHGLAVGMLLTMSTLCGLWLWVSKAVRGLWGVPMLVIVPVMLVTALLCRSSGAILLLLGAIGMLFFTKWTRLKVGLLAILVTAPMYMTLRTTDVWSGENLVAMMTPIFGQERAESSLGGRMANENLFTDKALMRPVFGWSGWDRFQVRDRWGKYLTTPDGLWVIALGQFGLVGLSALTLLLLLPGWLVYRHLPVQAWLNATVGPAAVLAAATALFMIDCLLNAMLSPLYVVIAGACLSVLPLYRNIARRTRPVAVPRRPARHPRPLPAKRQLQHGEQELGAGS